MTQLELLGQSVYDDHDHGHDDDLMALSECILVHTLALPLFVYIYSTLTVQCLTLSPIEYRPVKM